MRWTLIVLVGLMAWACGPDPNAAALSGDSGPVQTAQAQALPPPAAAQPQRALPQSQSQVMLSFAPVVDRAAPAVVNIYTKKTVRQAPMMQDPFFRFFFGDRQMPGRERVERSLGSGVIVRADGLIITNRHVVGEADEITVVLADRREFDARVVLQDPRSDLAVVRINTEGKNLPVMPLGDSDRIKVGDMVLAIGNPFGVGQTVTNGIVSAVRSGGGPTDYQYYIQTDAAINPGNSGGALVSMTGELIGVNTFIFSQTGGSVGIGFAVPANLVRAVVNAAANGGGRIVRPWIGVEGQPVDSDTAKALKLERPVGVLVNSISPASPAVRAGLRTGDVIFAFDGQEVSDMDSLRFRLATRQVGSSSTLTVIRDGKPVTLNVALIAPPETPARSETIVRQSIFTGAKVANLSPAVQAELGLPLPDRGVVVLETAQGSPAQQINLQPGDVIAAVNGQRVESVQALQPALAAAGNAVTFVIQRSGRAIECGFQPGRGLFCRQ
jgi:Do/DeqQ family serine protease